MKAYNNIIRNILSTGDEIETRNGKVKSIAGGIGSMLTATPLVTARKTAWKKALREMEWFLSGSATCPEELLDWWRGQLHKKRSYYLGYGNQLRYSTFAENVLSGYPEMGCFDQIEWLINELKTNPNSRRLLTTTWNPGEMANITETNQNPNTPATCHGTVTQYFVRNGVLSFQTHQRSADILLGVPHNWIQYWAFGLWLAHRTGLKFGHIIWIFGDVHIYLEESHVKAAQAILKNDVPEYPGQLVYSPTSDDFKASDFSLSEPVPEPVVKIRPKLL